MHESSVKTIVKWYAENYAWLHGELLADLGSYNINGKVSDFIPENIVGFDVYEGENVDVVLEPGIVPEAHQGKYTAVISANVFHLCGDMEAYKKEVVQLLESKGLFILTMCSNRCNHMHNTSPNKYGFKDGIRMSAEELQNFWKDALNITDVFERGHDLVLTGAKQ